MIEIRSVIKKIGFPLVLISMLSIVVVEIGVGGIVATIGLNIVILLILIQVIAMLYGFAKSLVIFYKSERHPLYSPVIIVKKMYVMIAVIIVAALIIVAGGNLDYDGHQALAAHYIHGDSWSDEACKRCHGGKYEKGLRTFHVLYASGEIVRPWDPLFLDPALKEVDTRLAKENFATNCSACHVNDIDPDGACYLASPSSATCARKCHCVDVEKRAVMWCSDDYAAYDVHADADVICIQCHVNGNARGNIIDRPDSSHLIKSALKKCTDCHAGVTHGLIEDACIEKVSCESCHIPALPGGDLPGGSPIDSIDYSDGERRVTYHTEDFEPTLAYYNGTHEGMPHPSGKDDPGAVLKPFNVITIRWWDKGDDSRVVTNPNSSLYWGNPIPLSHVRAADSSNDGEVSIDEMRGLDFNDDGTPDYPDAVLRQVDVYYSVSHNIVGEESALGRGALWCADCHGNRSRINWTLLGFESDPAETDPPTDFTTYNITVETIPTPSLWRLFGG